MNLLNTHTVSIPVLLSTYHAILIDVILILVFMLGFKFFTAYLMVVMTKWFEDEDEAAKKTTKVNPSVPTPAVPLARKVLWIGLAVLWILNGVDQFRPVMVVQSAAMLDHVALSASPTWFSPWFHWVDKLWAQRPIWSNISSAVLQLTLGMLMLLSREKLFGKISLWMSIVFSLVVWIFGEYFGFLLHSGGGYLVGGPGAGLLYAMAAMVLLTPLAWWGHLRPFKWIRVGFFVFWLFSAVWQLAPWTNLWNRTGVLQSLNRIVPNVPWLAFLHRQMAATFGAAPVAWNLVFIGIFLGLAALTWWRFDRTFGLLVSLLWLLLSWVFGQAIGMAGGMALPLNSASVLVLLLMVGWLDAHPNLAWLKVTRDRYRLRSAENDIV